MGPTWGPPGADRTKVGPMLAPWSLLSGMLQLTNEDKVCGIICELIHWNRGTHICVSNLTIIASDNGVSPGRCQAIIWNKAGILLIGSLGTNFSEILNKIDTISFKKMYLKMPSGKWRPFCFSLNVLSELKLWFMFSCSHYSAVCISCYIGPHYSSILSHIRDWWVSARKT